jgi:RNA polymerase sigma factor (TIGR02999 family)
MKRVEEAFGGCGRGAQRSGAELLPLVYEDLLRLATRQLAKGWACGAFEPAELVHEAWLRLVGGHDRGWSHRGHFFAAAVETMRRLLVEHARRAGRRKRGGGSQWVDLERVQLPAPAPEEPLLALKEALGQLAVLDFAAAELVRLRFFVGLTQSAAAQQLGLSRSGADRAWFFARAWLLNQLRPVELHTESGPQVST